MISRVFTSKFQQILITSVSGLRALHIQSLSNRYSHKYDLSTFTIFFQSNFWRDFDSRPKRGARAGRVLPFKLWGPLPVTVKKGHFAPNWKALTTHFVVLVVVQNYYPIRLVDLRALKESCCSRPPFLFRAQFEPSYALNWKRRKKKLVKMARASLSATAWS